jgi:uncharacterized protein Usg
MRKSRTPETAPKGNAAKYLSYREAWTRIRSAQVKGYYLEAVTLEESIISDRLIGYLIGVGAIQPKANTYKYPGFGQLLQLWKKQHPDPIALPDMDDLHAAVDAWRVNRNNIVHGIVKSHPGTATEDIDDFLATAEMAAARGERLAKAVSTWCRKAARPAAMNEMPESNETSPVYPGASKEEEGDAYTTLLQELGFPLPVYVRGRTSVADLFKPDDRCGIYVLHFTTGELYAGKAVDVTRRYIGHRQNHPDIEKVSFRCVPEPDLDVEEQRIIESLEHNGIELRNIIYTSIPRGESDFDLVMAPEVQDRWLQDLTFVDHGGTRLVEPNLRRKYARKYQEFSEFPYAGDVVGVLRTYVQLAIPAYRRGEVSFWAVSCLASGSIARVNVFWQEVFSIHEREDLLCSLYLAKSPFLEAPQEQVDALFELFPSAGETEHRYRPGGSDQVNLIVAAAEAEAFIQQPLILDAMRLFNFRLMKKGPCNFGRYHCMDLADYLVEPTAASVQVY